jgi:hypothetical protein
LEHVAHEIDATPVRVAEKVGDELLPNRNDPNESGLSNSIQTRAIHLDLPDVCICTRQEGKSVALTMSMRLQRTHAKVETLANVEHEIDATLARRVTKKRYSYYERH